MSSNKNNHKSISRELGWGHSKILNDKKLSDRSYGEYGNYSGRLMCPRCFETLTRNLLELRCDFWECRTCGYANDVSGWDKNPKRIPKVDD